jgi:hypothetical protein
MKSVLKAPGPVLLKLRYDGPLLNFAFNFNVRRCILVLAQRASNGWLDRFLQANVVGRCRLILSNPH